MKTNTLKSVEEVVNLIESCYNGEISRACVEQQLSGVDSSLDNKVFWHLYSQRNSYEDLRSSHGYDYYDALLDIYKETSKFYGKH